MHNSQGKCWRNILLHLLPIHQPHSRSTHSNLQFEVLRGHARRRLRQRVPELQMHCHRRTPEEEAHGHEERRKLDYHSIADKSAWRGGGWWHPRGRSVTIEICIQSWYRKQEELGGEDSTSKEANAWPQTSPGTLEKKSPMFEGQRASISTSTGQMRPRVADIQDVRLTFGPVSSEAVVRRCARVLQNCLLGPDRDWAAAVQWRASVLPQPSKAQ